MQADNWQTLASKTVYETPWLLLREDKIIRPSGEEGIFVVLEYPSPGVSILALNEKNEAYLIKQYRYARSAFSLELPGGFSDNEDPLLAAKRELKEETGLSAQQWDNLGMITLPMACKNAEVYFFLARDLSQGPYDETYMQAEGVESVKTVPFTALRKMVTSGEITSASTIAAIYQAECFLSLPSSS